nr:3-phosphoshikimate 1-carboxyvinyltransferase [Oscillospiraceae bacterium]
MIRYVGKGQAEGRVSAPTSKSVAHRLLIAAAMCEGQRSVIDGITPCEDVLATIECLRVLGVKIVYDGSRAAIEGIDFKKAKPSSVLKCRESGSTLRFLIPIALLSGEEMILSGSEKLISRPQGVYEEIASDEGFLFKKDIGKITVKGRLRSGEYRVRGDVSSQFITGLIFALSALDGDSKILLTTKIESRSYVELTISALSEFGVKVEWEGDSALQIKGGQKHTARELRVEGDWSGTAFIEALNFLGGSVTVDGLNENSLQGDRVYREHFASLDGGFCEINIEDCPDLGPILFTIAALKHGGRFTGTKRLKIKESDRARAMMEELSKFGASLLIEENSVTVLKRELHQPRERICGHNDHRIVMSLAVILTRFGGEIEGCEAVSKSYPDFFEDIKELGITTYEI